VLDIFRSPGCFVDRVDIYARYSFGDSAGKKLI
jgi:hypothetical protein